MFDLSRTKLTFSSLSRILPILLSVMSATPARAQAPLDIIVVKRSGVSAYQEVTDEFAENCRVRARVVNLGDGPLRFHPNDVVLAVGQQAVDAVLETPARMVSALAFHVPARAIAADAIPPPELSLRALKAARPSVRRVGVVYGPRTEALVASMEAPARVLGLQLVRARATDGPGAVRALHLIAHAVDAIWLAPDLDVLVPQLFQYALGLQIRENLPLVVVTRQQVKSGGLLAVDAEPRAVGRQAAQLVNELLAGTPAETLVEAGQTGTLDLVVNGDVARRLGADLASLKALGLSARIE